MIGKVYLAVVDFYDSKSRTTRKKGRPVLVIAGPKNNDYTVLPISTIPHREHLDPVYDLLVGSAERTVLGLPQECYIRTHKQTVLHQAALVREKGDMKCNLPDLYLAVLEKMEQHQREIMDQAIT
jgi:uncharacterized protein YifN (PemK superfamily)